MHSVDWLCSFLLITCSSTCTLAGVEGISAGEEMTCAIHNRSPCNMVHQLLRKAAPRFWQGIGNMNLCYSAKITSILFPLFWITMHFHKFALAFSTLLLSLSICCSLIIENSSWQDWEQGGKQGKMWNTLPTRDFPRADRFLLLTDSKSLL